MKRKTATIGSYTVGDGHPCVVVAELGVNHLGDPGRMKEMIAAAHEAGADLLKFQTYQADKRYDAQNNPKGRAFIEMTGRWQLDRETEAELWEYAHSIGAQVFTSAFDPDSARFAQELGTLAYKLAAFEVVNMQLVRAACSHGKPIVFSRGMATDDEVQRVLDTAEASGVESVILHTISSYPTLRTDSNLRKIHTLREKFPYPVGHSDHTRGTSIPPLAVAAGANMIEKHFTVNRKLRDSDNPFSVTPGELREIVFKVRQTEEFMGDGDITKIETEGYMWDFRRETD